MKSKKRVVSIITLRLEVSSISMKNKNGKNALDMIVKVPLGTTIKDIETGAIIGDLTKNGEEIIVAKEYGIAYSTSTLIRFLTGIGKTSRIVYHISKNENNILY